jgi:hypothetical protein
MLLVKSLFPKSWRKNLGIQGNYKLLLISVLLLTPVYYLVNYLIINLYQTSGVHCEANPLLWKLVPIFQAFNEEIFLRALLTNLLLKYFKSMNLINLLLSVSFMLLHYMFYRYGSQQNALPLIALGTLFFFSYGANLIYFKTQSIFIPYIIHVCWSLNKFGYSCYFIANNQYVSEAMSLHLIEGDYLTFIISILFVLVTFGCLSTKLFIKS